ncbi:uncharacterized protein B0H18DRAFT_1116858 [Fomitopsis serialis]|uniref:uncharacterized protein n=1 Tax=Fomitopsis serialis TaxID=139415 RepID=UPI00200876D2|nr:uncharacterized protein B0H18DRAFT_1116858 [Neoantrodia serialis]KAH9930747.1 hypothetical protein B0H18DRAFT_1116858 [Neoantrodia serialis]
MSVTRGFTEEADKLLDYMEHGIFDALQKQYLRSFILGIYLDNDDPNNIVEAYTFNFDYQKIPGTDITVPVMSLDADLERLSLNGKKTFDPVSDATRQGRVPTLGEVKRSLKATTQMDALPRDAKKDRWFFTTHERSEVPEKCSIGSLQTGHHGVNVRIASVSGYLPSTEDNSAPFLGTTGGHTYAAPVLTPAEEASVRVQQMEIQRRDAIDRRVVWDADDGMCDADADGEEDPDYIPGSSGDGGRVDDSGVEFFAPIGVRDEAGNVQSLNEQQSGPDGEVRYTGRVDSVPNRIAQLAEGGKHSEEPIQQTQQLEETQVIDSPAIAPSPLSSSPSPSPSPTPQPRTRNRTARRVPSFDSPLPPSDMLPESMTSGSPIIHEPGSIDTQLVKDLIIHACTTGEDTDMLAQTDKTVGESVDVVECECGVTVEDCDCLKCEGDCKKWFHMWCMGFHSAKDKRLPARFVCFDCRVRADQNWELIVVHDLYPRMTERFKDLAIFRRAIKVFEKMKPDSLSAFTKLIACDSTVAGQVFKRLETEGFIAQAGETLDTEYKMDRKPRYVFVSASSLSQAYKDYFDPDPEVEKRVLGLSDLEQANLGSQTQQESQLAGTLPPDGTENQAASGELKRKTSKTPNQLQTRPSKRVKISLGPAVDLGD